jgi:hypothetical protein
MPRGGVFKNAPTGGEPSPTSIIRRTPAATRFGVFIYWGMYAGVPLLERNGIPLVIAFALLSLPGIALLILSLVAYRLDGYPWIWNAFRVRFRLHSIRGKEWLWVIGIFILCTGLDEGLQVIGKWLATIPLFAPSNYLPALFHPIKEISLPITEFLGAPLMEIGGYWRCGFPLI